MSGRLDRKLVKQLSKKASTEFAAVQHLNASNQQLKEVGSLQYLPGLVRLDLSRNQLVEIGGVEGCASLRQLNLSANQLTSLKGFTGLPGLQVLNVGQNQIAGKLELSGLPSLGALIANDNAISGLKDLGGLTALNTLVLKNNRVASLGKALAACSALAKLSMAHNQLGDLATSLAACSQLAELRLGHNLLTGLPDSLAACSRLKIVDLGGNLVESLTAIKVLAKLPHLNSLTLKGCPVADGESYQRDIQAMLPHLQTLDNRRLDGSVRRAKHGTPAADHEGSQEMQAAPAETPKQQLKAGRQPGEGMARVADGGRVLPAHPGDKAVGKKRRGEGQAEAEGRIKDRQSDGVPEVAMRQGNEKKQKRLTHKNEALGDVGTEGSVAVEARAEEPKRKKKKRSAASGKVPLGDREGDGPEGPPPKVKQKKKKVSREADQGEAVEKNRGAAEPEVAPQKSLPVAKHLKAGMRGAQVGAVLQSVVGDLTADRPLAPAWD